MAEVKQYASQWDQIGFIPAANTFDSWYFTAGMGRIVAMEMDVTNARVMVSTDRGRSWRTSNLGRYRSRPGIGPYFYGNGFYVPHAYDTEGDWGPCSLFSADGENWTAQPWTYYEGIAHPPGLAALASQMSWDGQPPIAGIGGFKVMMRRKDNGRMALVVSDDGMSWRIAGLIGESGATVFLAQLPLPGSSSACDGRYEVTSFLCVDSSEASYAFMSKDLDSGSVKASGLFPLQNGGYVPEVLYDGAANSFLIIDRTTLGMSVVDPVAMSSAPLDVQHAGSPNPSINMLLAKEYAAMSPGLVDSNATTTSPPSITLTKTDGSYGVNGKSISYEGNNLLTMTDIPRHGAFAGFPVVTSVASWSYFIHDDEGTIAILRSDELENPGAYLYRMKPQAKPEFWTNKVGTRET